MLLVNVGLVSSTESDPCEFSKLASCSARFQEIASVKLINKLSVMEANVYLKKLINAFGYALAPK